MRAMSKWACARLIAGLIAMRLAVADCLARLGQVFGAAGVGDAGASLWVFACWVVWFVHLQVTECRQM